MVAVSVTQHDTVDILFMIDNSPTMSAKQATLQAALPGFWAALSVVAALTHFLFAWWALRFVSEGTPWGLISVGLAVPTSR